MYGGMCQAEYFQSCIKLTQALNGIGVDHDFLITTNESLIQRARNTSVARFLKTDHSHLMFIDGDIDFSPDDVAGVWNLQEKSKITCGLYRMKVPDAPLCAWVDGQLVEAGESPHEVDYCGTGFLMIHREVFESFLEQWPERKHQEGVVGDCFDWFSPRVIRDFYASEDYAFCHDARELGYSIWADPRIKLGHWGRYRYG